MVRFDPIEPHGMLVATTGPYVKFSEVENTLKDLKGELRDEYGSNGEFAAVYATLRMVGEKLGIVV